MEDFDNDIHTAALTSWFGSKLLICFKCDLKENGVTLQVLFAFTVQAGCLEWPGAFLLMLADAR